MSGRYENDIFNYKCYTSYFQVKQVDPKPTRLLFVLYVSPEFDTKN